MNPFYSSDPMAFNLFQVATLQSALAHNNFMNMMMYSQQMMTNHMMLSNAMPPLNRPYPTPDLSYFGYPPIEGNKPEIIKVEDNDSFINIPQTAPKEREIKQTTRTRVTEIVEFILKNVGVKGEKEIEEYQSNFISDKNMTTVFQYLKEKFCSSTKTKEEMIKFIIRRAFKFIKNKIKRVNNVDSKTACMQICEKYFGKTVKDFQELGLESYDEDEFFNALLPFR